MTQEDLKTLVSQAVTQALHDRNILTRADDPDYEERVAWVRNQMQKEQDLHKMRQKVFESTVIWASLAFVAYVTTLLYKVLGEAFIEWVRKGGH